MISRRGRFTTQEVVCVSRGTARRKPEQATAPPPPKPEEAAAPQEPDLVRSIDLPEDITFRYARASGDDNRIHVDDEFAKSVGLPGIIVQGTSLFSIALQAVVEAAAPGRSDRLQSASVRFRSPIQPGNSFETLVYADGRTILFEGRGPGGQPVLTGSATTQE